ncbi:MAG: glycine zipper domain-containing protein [Sulfuricella sp.]
MKLFAGLTGIALLGALAVPAYAGVDGNAVLGGALGGATGAAIGSAVGGRDGAIIGGAIGGATGTAVMTSNRREPSVRREVVYVDEHDHHDNGRHRGHYKHGHGRGGDRYDD